MKKRRPPGARGAMPATSKIRRTQVQAYGTRNEWGTICKRIKKRDGNKCRKCSATEELQVDHIIPVSCGGMTVDSNLWTICLTCHCKRPKHRKVAKLLKAGANYRANKKKDKS